MDKEKLEMRKKQIEGRNKNFAFKFNSWMNGIQIRYFTSIFLYAAIAVTIQILLQEMLSKIGQIANLIDNSSSSTNITEQLRHLDNTFKVDCSVPSFPVTVIDQNTVNQAAAANNSTAQQLLTLLAQFMCISQQSSQFQQSVLDYFFTLNIFIAFQYIVLLMFFLKTNRPIKHLFFNLAFLFDFMLFLASFLIIVYTNPVAKKLVNQFDGSRISVYVDWGNIVGEQLAALYSVCMGAMWMRLFFSFKVTRLFGPFIKIIKLNIKYFLKWLLIFMLCLLTATAAIMLVKVQGLEHVDSSTSQNMQCDSMVHCLFFLIQGSVGQIGFQQLPNKWYSDYFYSFLIIVFMVLFLSILIASMTNTYNEIVQRGQLYYQKEIFDLRYLYNTQTRYGALAAFEFPLVLFQFFTVFIFWCFELCFQRSKNSNKIINNKFSNEKKNVKRKFNLEQNIKPRPLKKYCCLCWKITKVNQSYPTIQLEDINLIILKLIHFANIITIFTPIVFALGFLLIPIAYFSIIIIKISIMCRKKSSKQNVPSNCSYQTIGIKKNYQRLKQQLVTRKSSKCKLFFFLVLFILFGLLYLIIRHFYDTFKFIQECFTQQNKKKNQTRMQYKGKETYFLLYTDIIKAVQIVSRQKKIKGQMLKEEMYEHVNSEVTKEQKQIKISEGKEVNPVQINMQIKELSQMIINVEDFYGQSITREISNNQKDPNKSEMVLNNTYPSPLTQNIGSPDSYGKYFDSSRLRMQKNRQAANKSLRGFQVLVKNDNQKSQSIRLSLIHRKSGLQKLFQFFQLEQNLKNDYEIPLKNLQGILFGFLKMQQVRYKLKKLKQNSMRKLGNSIKNQSQFNLSINGQEFKGIYNVVSDDMENDSFYMSSSFLGKQQSGNQFFKQNLPGDHHEAIEHSKSLFNIIDQSTEQQNEVFMKRKQLRHILQKQHTLQQEYYLRNFKAFVNSQAILQKAFGILTFGSFNLKSSLEGCYQFCLEKRRDQTLSDVQALLLSYNYIDTTK